MELMEVQERVCPEGAELQPDLLRSPAGRHSSLQHSHREEAEHGLAGSQRLVHPHHGGI